MSDSVSSKNTHDDVPDEQKLAELHRLIKGIDIAMLTTRDEHGRLVSRPMATQAFDESANIWFMSSTETHKIDEIEKEPNVNVAYLSSSKQWVSLSGVAKLDRDRERIAKMYKPDWKAWFEDKGGEYDGGPADPRIVLIDVVPEHVTYFKIDEPRPVVLFEIAKAALTKSTPNIGAIRNLDV